MNEITDVIGIISVIGIFVVIISTVISLLIAYFIIRISVKHGVDSSRTAAIISKMDRENENLLK